MDAKLGGLVTQDEFHAHAEEAFARCVRMHGSVAATKERVRTDAMEKKPAGWAGAAIKLAQTPLPYIVLCVLLVVIMLAHKTGRPADDFVPHARAEVDDNE